MKSNVYIQDLQKDQSQEYLVDDITIVDGWFDCCAGSSQHVDLKLDLTNTLR